MCTTYTTYSTDKHRSYSQPISIRGIAATARRPALKFNAEQYPPRVVYMLLKQSDQLDISVGKERQTNANTVQ